MSFGSNLIAETLLNASSITSLVDTFATQPAIWHDIVCPESYKGTDSINFYLTAPVNGGLEFGLYTYTINCRANTFQKAIALQNEVFDTFNRHSTSSERGFYTCNALQAIPPSSEDDTYNAIVEVKLKI